MSDEKQTLPQGQAYEYTLTALEHNLQDSIKTFPVTVGQDDAENALLQADGEIVAVKKATISQLDSTLKEPKFSEFGAGLKEHQEHTKSLLDNIIKQKEANAEKLTDAAKKTEKEGIEALKVIQTNLKKVHEARLSLLDEYQNKETETRNKHAYGLLKNHWNLKDPATPVKGGVINTTDPTIDDHFQQSEFITKTNDEKSWIRKLPNGCIVGTDPRAVGYATAATNDKEIEFSGEPQQALKAAIAAFDAGAKSVSLSTETLASLNNSASFKNPAEWKKTMAEYEAFMKRQAARAEIKNSKSDNPVFSPKTPEDKASDNLKTFNKLPLDPDPKKASLAQMQMLISMDPKDVAELAWKAREQSYTGQHVKGLKYFNQLYRQVLQEKYPAPSFSVPFASKPYQEFRKVAYETYQKQLLEEKRNYTNNELVKLKEKRDILQVAKQITTQDDADVQKELFNALPPLANDGYLTLDRPLTVKEARAICLIELMEQYKELTMTNDKEKVLAEFEDRIGGLLDSLSSDEKKAIQDITGVMPKENQTELNKKYREIYDSKDGDWENLRQIFDSKLKLNLWDAQLAGSTSLRAKELSELMVNCDTELKNLDNQEARETILVNFKDNIQKFKIDSSDTYFQESLAGFIEVEEKRREGEREGEEKWLDKDISAKVEQLADPTPTDHSNFSLN